MPVKIGSGCRERVDICLKDKMLQSVVLAGVDEIMRTWAAGRKKYPANKQWRFSTQIKHIKAHCDRLTTDGWDDEGSNHTHIGAVICRAAIMANDYREKHGELNDFVWSSNEKNKTDAK